MGSRGEPEMTAVQEFTLWPLGAGKGWRQAQVEWPTRAILCFPFFFWVLIDTVISRNPCHITVPFVFAIIYLFIIFTILA